MIDEVKNKSQIITENRELIRENELLKKSREILEKIAKEHRENEERFRFLYENVPLAYHSLDKDCIIVEVNEVWCRELGYKLDEVLGRNFTDFLKDGFKRKFKKDIEEYKKNGSIRNVEFEMLKKDGSVVIMSCSSQTKCYKNGTINQTCCILNDITARKKAEARRDITLETLLESEKRYEFATEAGNVGVWDIDLGTNEIHLDTHLKKMLGYEDHEISNKLDDWTMHVYSEDIENVMNKFQDLIDGKISEYVIENRMVHKDGSIGWFLVQGKALYNNSGKPYRVIGTDTDITKRKQAELQRDTMMEILKESEERYRSIFKTVPVSIILLNKEGQILDINPYHINNFGKDQTVREDFIGTNVLQCKSIFEAGLSDKFEKILAGELLNLKDVYFPVIEGRSDRYLNVRGVPLKKDGEVTGAVLIFEDITKSKRREEELQKYSETQKILVKEINHRVRNNLTAIMGMLFSEETLAEEKGKPEFLPLIRNLIARVDGLSTVHSLLSESGWRPLKLDKLCEEIVNIPLKSLYSTKAINLTITPSEVRVSSNRAHNLALVINELITNSLKHALQNRNEAIIYISIMKEGENVKLRFRDDGPGYPKEMIEGDNSKMSTGFELIQGIVKQNLMGEIDIHNDNGAVTIITFKNE